MTKTWDTPTLAVLNSGEESKFPSTFEGHLIGEDGPDGES